MASFTIFDPTQLQQEIRQSHERSRRYGINPDVVVFPNHVHLSASELGQRLETDPEFFVIVLHHLEALYKLFEGADFALGYADCDGYILQMIGDNPILEDLARIKCKPGYRWTERDVGTSSIALCLARGIPVQITREECFCARGHRYTNSAAPVFHENGSQVGVIYITGRAASALTRVDPGYAHETGPHGVDEGCIISSGYNGDIQIGYRCFTFRISL